MQAFAQKAFEVVVRVEALTADALENAFHLWLTEITQSGTQDSHNKLCTPAALSRL